MIEWTELDEEAAREGRTTGPRTSYRVSQRTPFNVLDELCSRKQKVTDTATTTLGLDSLLKSTQTK